MMTVTTGWARASAFTAHDSLVDLIVRYARHREVAVNRVLDLWAPSGTLATALSSRWPTAQMLGICPDEASVEACSSADAPMVQWSQADPSGPGPHLDPTPDLIIGVPPWHWAPQHLAWRIDQETTVELADDPANAALLEASTRLPRTGLGFFVVGPGFLMRPGSGTAFAQFDRFGLHVDGAISLPRGSFTPDCGSGRVLLVVSRTPQPDPVFGQFTPEHDTVDQLLRSSAMGGEESRRLRAV